MNCTPIRDWIVAWQDGELPAGPRALVEAHLSTCGACRAHERALRLATPEPGEGLSLELRNLAWARIDAALAQESMALSQPPLSVAERLGERVALPISAVAGYLLVLTLAVAWGLSNWWTASALQAEIAGRAVGAPATLQFVPAEDFRPAAYALPSDEEPTDTGSARLTFEAGQR